MIYSENILVCIAIPILLTLFYIKGNARRYAAFFVVGMGVCLLSAYISGYVDYQNTMGEEWTSIYVSPVVEEIMKLLPLLFYLFLLVPEDDKLFPSGTALAAGFATFENCCYILSSGAGSFSFILIRGLAVGVMHIVSILALCLGLVLVRRFKVPKIPGIIGALSFSMSFHDLYNVLVSEPGTSTFIGYVVPVITAVLLYIPYRRLVGSAD